MIFSLSLLGFSLGLGETLSKRLHHNQSRVTALPVPLLLHCTSIDKLLICSRISKVNREEDLAKAENDLATVVNQYIGKLVKELQGLISGS